MAAMTPGALEKLVTSEDLHACQDDQYHCGSSTSNKEAALDQQESFACTRSVAVQALAPERSPSRSRLSSRLPGTR